jgi:TonB family protein
MASFEKFLVGVAEIFFRFWGQHKVGILGTIAINMVLVVFLLLSEMRSQAYLYETIINLDFEREYELNPKKEKEPIDPIFDKNPLPDPAEYEAIRNIAVDATSKELNPGLTDEKKIDADELYQQAARAREQMQSNKQKWDDAQTTDEPNVPNVEEKNTAPKDVGKYSGPTVISYYLEGRKARRLPVPAYQCENGGQVVVDIEVNQEGFVVRTNVDTDRSVNDNCLTDAAIRAASNSRFSASTSAAVRQKGSITYLFVPQ